MLVVPLLMVLTLYSSKTDFFNIIFRVVHFLIPESSFQRRKPSTFLTIHHNLKVVRRIARSTYAPIVERSKPR